MDPESGQTPDLRPGEKVINIADDHLNVVRAALELLRNEVIRKKNILSGKSELDLPRPSLADGYYYRAEYLLKLSDSIVTKWAGKRPALPKEDEIGLTAIRLAYEMFSCDHVQCTRCWGWSDPTDSKCLHCGADFKQEAN